MSHAWTHSWCKSPCRDEAARASEDGREGPLPTLDECIERQKHAAMTGGVKEGFVKADGEWKRLTDDELRQILMIPKTASASSAVEQENKGNDMRPPTTKTATVENDLAEPAKCSPSLSENGEGQSGLRTERVTLEVTHRFEDPIASVLLQAIDSVLAGQGESVFVMDGSCEITKLTDERDAAIRERDELKARVDYLERDRKFWCLQSGTHEQAANVLRARVAELESAAKLAPAANADAVSNPRPISGAGKSAGEETQTASGAADEEDADIGYTLRLFVDGRRVLWHGLDRQQAGAFLIAAEHLAKFIRTEYQTQFDEAAPAASGAAGTEAEGTELPTD